MYSVHPENAAFPCTAEEWLLTNRHEEHDRCLHSSVKTDDQSSSSEKCIAYSNASMNQYYRVITMLACSTSDRFLMCFIGY